MNTNLPPLPEPARIVTYNESKGYTCQMFTADQMHAYARTSLPQTGEEPVAIALHTGTKQGIKWLAKTVEHGTKLYDAPQPAPPDDMKVYDAIAANYTAVPLPAREPLTDDEFISLMDSDGIGPVDPGMALTIKELVERAYGIAPPVVAQSATTPTPAQIGAAARVLNARYAIACGVDVDDCWHINGDDFKDDARAALEAAHGITATPADKEQP